MKRTILSLIGAMFISKMALANAEAIYTVEQLKQNQRITEYLLLETINTNQIDALKELLVVYDQIEHKDPRLTNYAKLKLIQQSFSNYENRATDQALQDFFAQKDLTQEEKQIAEQYRTALAERDRWQFSFGAHYLYTKNVNNATRDRNIEDTGFVKSESLLPQSARGFGYYLSAERNWNLQGSHYLHFSNDLSGKSYWDKHDYDEINNRTYLGYQYQNAHTRLAFKPFYERQWFGNHRYNISKGARGEWAQFVAKNWQISTALEFSQLRYFSSTERNGNIKLASLTAIWYPSNKAYLYLGTDFIREKAREKQYSNDIKALRFGWKQLWDYQLVTQLNLSLTKRQFKDFAVIGRVFHLDKMRKDKIYNASLTLWKQDWQWQGFVPKLQFKYKNQKSNIPTMYSYKDKYVQMLIEKEF